MIEIETFLRDSSGDFVHLDSCRVPPPDAEYIEGALQVSVGGQEVLGLREWDYVDQIWCYIAEMVTQWRSAGCADSYFPDGPIRISFREVPGGRVVVSVDIGAKTREVQVSSADWLNAVREAGVRFFEKMSALVPDNAEAYEEARRKLLF